MAWTPSRAVLTARTIPETLFEFFETYQEDALTWAGGTNLKKIKTFAQTVAARSNPVYPLLLLVDDNDAQDLGDDIIGGAYQCTFELGLTNRNPETLVSEARKYTKAICSMIANCTLTTSTGATVATVQTIEVGFLDVKTNKAENEFYQEVQIKITCTLEGNAST